MTRSAPACVGELAVAVVHDDQRAGVGLPHDARDPFDLRDAQRFPQRIAARPLQIRHPRPLHRGRHTRVVGGPVGQQVKLLVANAELLERTVPARHNANHRLEGVVGQSGQRHHPVARPQHPEERGRDRVGARDEIVPDERVLRPHHPRQHPVEHLAAPVVVAVAGCARKVALAHVVFDEGGEHLHAVILRVAVDARERLAAGLLRLFRHPRDRWIDVKKLFNHTSGGNF